MIVNLALVVSDRATEGNGSGRSVGPPGLLREGGLAPRDGPSGRAGDQPRAKSRERDYPARNGGRGAAGRESGMEDAGHNRDAGSRDDYEKRDLDWGDAGKLGRGDTGQERLISRDEQAGRSTEGPGWYYEPRDGAQRGEYRERGARQQITGGGGSGGSYGRDNGRQRSRSRSPARR